MLQGQPGFNAPYSGTTSLHPGDNFRQTTNVDLFIDVHLWPGGEFYFNPEYYQGFGLGLTHGLVDFSNSMAYKVGKYRGDVNVPHLLYYNFEVHKGVNVTFDYQFAVNPAFNEDPGPINILGARIDLKF